MKKILIKCIYFYKKHISPWLEDRGVHCKFEPTCSEYTMQAINKYGALKGSFLSRKEKAINKNKNIYKKISLVKSNIQ